MTKPKNFPGRRFARMMKATKGIAVPDSQGARFSKKSLIGGSPGRRERHGGKIGRKGNG